MLDQKEELDLLKLEYQRLTNEIQMYLKEQYPRFTTAFTIIGAAVTWSVKDDTLWPVFFFVPIFIFAIAYMTVAQMYLTAVLSMRIKHIELRISQLNGGKPILEWEHKYVPKFIVHKHPPVLTKKVLARRCSPATRQG